MPLPIMPLAMGVGTALGAVNPLLRLLGMEHIEELDAPGQWLRGLAAHPADQISSIFSGEPGEYLSGNELLNSWGQSWGLLPQYEPAPMSSLPTKADPGPFVARPVTQERAPQRAVSYPEPFLRGPGVPPSYPPNAAGRFWTAPPVQGTLSAPLPEPELPPQIPAAPRDFGPLAAIAEMVLDPFTILGLGAGAKLGGKAAQALQGAQQFAERGKLVDQISDLTRVRDAANVGQQLTGTSDDLLTMLMHGRAGTPAYAAAEAAQQAPYSHVLLDEASDILSPPLTYNRVDAPARDMMLRTGLGWPGQTPGSVSVLPRIGQAAPPPMELETARLLASPPKTTRSLGPAPAERPSYLTGRGGKMFLNNSYGGLAGGRLDDIANMQPEELLLGGGRYEIPGVAGMLTPEEVANLSRWNLMDMTDADKIVDFGGVLRKGELPPDVNMNIPLSWDIGGEVARGLPREVNLLGMPLTEGADMANILLQQRLAELDKLGAVSQPNRLIQALYKMGFR